MPQVTKIHKLNGISMNVVFVFLSDGKVRTICTNDDSAYAKALEYERIMKLASKHFIMRYQGAA